jgi:hypothetical protein
MFLHGGPRMPALVADLTINQQWRTAAPNPKPTFALLAAQAAGTCKSAIRHLPEAVRS